VPERSGTSAPRRSLCPTVQPETSAFHRAKSVVRDASPAKHVRPPDFCHCWSVRLEQSPGPWLQHERHRSCCQAPARHFCSYSSSAPRTLGDFSSDALYKYTSTLILTKKVCIQTTAESRRLCGNCHRLTGTGTGLLHYLSHCQLYIVSSAYCPVIGREIA